MERGFPTFTAVWVSIGSKTENMKTCGKLFFVALMGLSIGCSLSNDDSGILVFTQNSDFSQTQDGWEADFTDFPTSPEDSVFYDLKSAYTDRPGNLGANLKSIMVSGNNHSDDLFMFLKKKVTGLSPNTNYSIGFDVELASNAQKGSAGIGGPPGEAVILKAGASAIEPRKIIDGTSYSLNVDKGNQAQGGTSTIVLGDIAVETKNGAYALLTRTSVAQNTAPFVVKTNAQGELWLIVGTDSGYEGVTTLYYTKVNVVFSTTN
ncbi:MAG: hypothetical protein ABIQ21_05680 [Chryseolinea sp.]